MRKALFLFLMAGCGSTVSVGNENPLGIVGGIVVDAFNEQPIAGATVTVTSANGQFSVATSMDGFWKAEKVPTGDLIVKISQMGYQTALLTPILRGAVGNFPVQNPTLTLGPIGLLKNDGTVSVRLIDQGGAAARSIRVTARTSVRYVDFNSGFIQSMGSYELEATSGPDGLATFMGLPNYAYHGSSINGTVTFDVPPQKVMGTEAYNFLGLVQAHNMHQLGSPVITLELAGPRTALGVRQSNVQYFVDQVAGPQGSIVAPGGPITISFNQAIDPATLRLQFLDEDFNQTNPTIPMGTVTTNLVTVTPSQALPAGRRFHLTVHANALGNGNEYNGAAAFFIATTAPVTVVTRQPEAVVGQVILTLSEPIGLGRGRTDPLQCVVFFKVDYNNIGGPGTADFRGEYSPSLQQLTCTVTPLTDQNHDPTGITTLEKAGVVPFMGFSSKWRINYGNPPTAACRTTIPCGPPGSNTEAHLVFPMAGNKDPNLVVRRANGQPVGDIQFTLP